MSKEFRWDSLDTIEIPVHIAGQDYVLVEASGAVARAWRGHSLKSFVMKEKGKGKSRESTTTMSEEVAESDILLLSQCFFKITPNGRQRVPMKELEKWPHRIIKPLFEEIKEISELNEDEESEGGDNDKDKDKEGNGSNSPLEQQES